MTYIANNPEMDYILEGETYEIQLQRFKEYWKSKDPNPQTEGNAVLMEYFRRIEYANAHFNLGNIHARNGQLAEAAQAYRAVLAIDPKDTNARNNLGVIYARQGKLDQAISQWERILEIEPGNQEVQDNISKAKKMTD